MSYRIHRGFFEPPAIDINTSGHRPVPSWLGDFDFSVYGGIHGKNLKSLRRPLKELSDEMSLLHPEQDFNTVFVQVYPTGTSVKRHRDPKNNVGHTLVAVFGEFDGATTTLYLEGDKQVSFTLFPGDVLSLPCTIDGVQGCPHEVSPVLSGTRYALILNTIEYGEAPDDKVALMNSLVS